MPYFYLGEDASIMIHDNLDSNVALSKLVIENEGYFKLNQNYQQIMCGLKRSALDSMFNTSNIWLKLFGYYYGYAFNKLLMALLSFFGMFILLKSDYFKKFHVSIEISLFVSVLFSILPIWSYTYSISGLPFLFYFFMQFRERKYSIYGFLFLIFYAFSSSLILVGFFFLFCFMLVLIYDWFKTKKINWGIFIAISSLSLLYILSHSPLFYTFFFDNSIESSRKDYKLPTYSFITGLEYFKNYFLNGHYHSFSLNKYFTLPVLLIVLLFFRKKEYKLAYFSMLWIIIATLISALISWDKMETISLFLNDVMPMNLLRFCFLNSFFWYLLLAISSSFIIYKYPRLKVLVFSFLFFQLLFIAKRHELIVNRNNPSFKEFYSEDQFNEIKNYINKPLSTYKVASVGIHPSIALYNGFYVIDGYSGNYPLSYKNEFYEATKGELKRSKFFYDYYKDWGSRCYVFSSEIGKLDFINFDIDHINNLKLDYKKLKEDFNTQYLFSPLEIKNEKKHLELLKKFPKNNSYWDIYVYKIKSL